MDKEKIRRVLIRAENIICCECESAIRNKCIDERPLCNSIKELREAIIELDKPKPYYPLGQEPMTKNCFTCKKYYSCDLPMDCQGRQWEADNL